MSLEVFVAGATGVIRVRLVPLLVAGAALASGARLGSGLSSLPSVLTRGATEPRWG
jgi:hypothetical protein